MSFNNWYQRALAVATTTENYVIPAEFDMVMKAKLCQHMTIARNLS